MFKIKRTYDPPARGDGRRILVERLWPRGMTKEALAGVTWMKEVAPSTGLRQWFNHRVERWREFRRRYRSELNATPDTWQPILDVETRRTVTLLYSARDTLHNGAVVLCEYLTERVARRASGGRRDRTPSRSKAARLRQPRASRPSESKSQRRPR